MITKFKIFENVTELDPYGEEDWSEPIKLKRGDVVRILPKINDYVVVGWPEIYRTFIGKEAVVYKPFESLDEDYCVIDTPFGVTEDPFTNGYYMPLNCVEKVESVLENVNDLDPYGEENWDDNEIMVGSIVRVTDKLLDYVNGPRLPNEPKFSDRVLVMLGNTYVVKKMIDPDQHNFRNRKWIYIDDFIIPIDCVELEN